jgi:hypothetical protein
MESIVYFATARATRWDYQYSLAARLERMLEAVGPGEPD